MELRAPPATAASCQDQDRPVVLIVEDDPDVGSLIAEILEDMGCLLLLADSGERALTLLDLHPVGLAIVDQTLPGMSGPAFAVQARASRPELRAIFISGAPIEAAAASDRVLPKPFRAAQLLAAVTALLECQTVG
jgi:DNA-binding response OmpR family regulator